MTDIHPTIARLAGDIKARREADTSEPDKPSAIDALRGVARAESDDRLAKHIAKHTPTTEQEN
jgi:hypothetical protein